MGARDAKYIAGTGGVSTSRGPLTPTKWNPSGLTTNCGFCSISYALERQKGMLIDADQLYTQTLQRLGIETSGNTDPIPRLLIFPGAGLDQAAIRTQYHELGERGRSPADYTIWSVARGAGLNLKSGDRELIQSLVEFAAQVAPRAWTLEDFVRARMNRPAFAGKASFSGMKSHVEAELKGDAIIGSIQRQHFVNLSIGPRGELQVFDAQKGQPFDGRRLKAEFGRLDLFERVTAMTQK